MLKLKIKFNFVVILMGSFSGGLTCLVKEPMVKTGSYIKTTNYNHFQFIPNSVDLVHYGVAPQNQVLHFNMSRNIYNYWFLRLQSLGPEKKIIQAERTNIYKHFVGVLPLAEYNSIWHQMQEQMNDDFEWMSGEWPPTDFQGLFRAWFLSSAGFAAFYLVFMGEHQDNNFYPTSGEYSVQAAQNDFRKHGVMFSIYFFKDQTLNRFYISPNPTIMPLNLWEQCITKWYWDTKIVNGVVDHAKWWPIVRLIFNPAAGNTILANLNQIRTRIGRLFNLHDYQCVISDAEDTKIIPKESQSHFPLPIHLTLLNGRREVYSTKLQVNLWFGT